MTMERIELQAQKRELIGRSQNSLRKDGFLPSVIYGHNFKPLPIQIKYSDFEKVFKKAGESTLINLKINDKEEPAVIKENQKDHVSEKKNKEKFSFVLDGGVRGGRGWGVFGKNRHECFYRSLDLSGYLLSLPALL